MREDVKVYDRLNLLFKMPYLGHEKGLFNGTWESFRSLLEKEIITGGRYSTVLYAVFDPFGLSLPEQAILIPYGLLHRVMEKEGLGAVYRLPGLWRYYSSESFYRRFEKDFMTRQVNAHFFLRYGIYLFYTGDSKSGLRYIREASHLGYDDAGVQCAAAIFFSDRGLFDLAREYLAKAPVDRRISLPFRTTGVASITKRETTAAPWMLSGKRCSRTLRAWCTERTWLWPLPEQEEKRRRRS